MATYAKISPKMVNPRDMAVNTEEEKEEEDKAEEESLNTEDYLASRLSMLSPPSLMADFFSFSHVLIRVDRS